MFNGAPFKLRCAHYRPLIAGTPFTLRHILYHSNDIQTLRGRDRQTDRLTKRVSQIGKEIDRQTDRDRDKNRQTDRQ